MRPRPGGVVGALCWAGVAAAVVATLVLVNLPAGPDGLLSLLQPGRAGPSAPVLADDFPELDPPAGAGNDGQQFYAIARDPLHPSAVAPVLDRPRYRLQRIGLPLLASGLDPGGGGGRPLVWALLAVNVAGAFCLALGLGLLAAAAGRWPGWALSAAGLPGVFVSLRITTADVLAVGAAVLAIALFRRGQVAVATATAVVAVLTKEVALVMIAGLVLPELWARRPAAWALVAAPAAVAGGWWLVLRIVVSTPAERVQELSLPLTGVVDALRAWSAPGAAVPAATFVATVSLAAVALRHDRRGPFAPGVAVLAVLLLCVSEVTLVASTHGPRTCLPLGAAALAALVSSTPAHR